MMRKWFSLPPWLCYHHRLVTELVVLGVGAAAAAAVLTMQHIVCHV